MTFGAQKHQTSLQVGASPISFPALLPPTSIWASPSPSPHPARRGQCSAGQRTGSEPPLLPSLQPSKNSLSREARGAAPSIQVTAPLRAAYPHARGEWLGQNPARGQETVRGFEEKNVQGQSGNVEPTDKKPGASLPRLTDAPLLPRLRLRVPVRPSSLSPPRKPVPPATGPPLSWPHLGVLPRSTASRPSPPGPLLPSASGAS